LPLLGVEHLPLVGWGRPWHGALLTWSRGGALPLWVRLLCLAMLVHLRSWFWLSFIRACLFSLLSLVRRWLRQSHKGRIISKNIITKHHIACWYW